MKNKLGFTLIEMLVVVLIIGILAGIALPQYNKAVEKSRLHTGVSLVESLYRAQQVYAIANGNYATDLNALDVEIPKDDSCIKTQTASVSKYECDFGTIGIYDSFSNIQYISSNFNIAYLHYLTDFSSGGLDRKAGEIWCFAKTGKDVAQAVCKEMGGKFGNSNSSWTRYKLR